MLMVVFGNIVTGINPRQLWFHSVGVSVCERGRGVVREKKGRRRERECVCQRRWCIIIEFF